MAVQFCVVCGRGSSRSSWNYSVTIGPNTYVACDFHDQNEFNWAVANVSAPPDPTITVIDPGTDVSPQG